MDIFTFIYNEHQRLHKLIDSTLAEKDKTKQNEMFEKTRNELILHGHSEQETFYRELGKHELTKSEVMHAKLAHKTIEDTLNRLNPFAPNWVANMIELKNKILNHFEEEYLLVFPQAKMVISPEKALELTQQMQNYRETKSHAL